MIVWCESDKRFNANSVAYYRQHQHSKKNKDWLLILILLRKSKHFVVPLPFFTLCGSYYVVYIFFIFHLNLVKKKKLSSRVKQH